jgi:RecA-family ATPase
VAILKVEFSDSMNHNNVNSELVIPDHVQKRLSECPPAGKGSGRHDDIKWITGQLSAQGFDEESIFQICRYRYIDQPDKDDGEIRRLISGAAKLGYKPVTGGQSTPRFSLGHVSAQISRVKPYEHDGSKEEIPADSIDLKYSEFFKSVLGFKDDEAVWFGWSEYRDFEREDAYGNPIEPKFIQCDIGITVADIAARQDNYSGRGIGSDVGSFFSVNPYKTGNGKRVPENLSRFLYTMVESDTLPREEQIAIYKKSGLPIKCLLDTGGDSIHAIIKVDAANFEEYKERVANIHEFLGGKASGFDATQDPVRFSRLPNSKRTEKGSTARQRLIATNIGAASWDEWESENLDDGLPEDSDLSEFLSELIEEPKHIVQNFIRKGQVVSISGGMKTYKSWTAMELALAVTNGTRFVKWEANCSKVFYVDTELEGFDFQKRMLGIAEQMKISVDPGECRKMLLRGREISIDMLVPGLIRRLQGKGFDLIVIDAAYSLLGHREENRNEHISEFGRVLHKLAKETGAAVALVLHHSKGSQIGKRGIEKASGAGAWGRFVDMSLSIDQHPDEGCYNFEPTYRSFAPEAPFVARRNGDIWSVETGLKVESKSSSAKQIGVTDILDVLVNECGGEASRKDWVEACENSLGISAQTLDDRREKAAKQGLLDVSGKTKSMKTKLAAGVVKNSETGRYERKGKILATLVSSAKAPEQPF